MPTLSEVAMLLPLSNCTGSFMLATIFSAMSSASSRECSGVSNTANSSPPRRATRSCSRSWARMRSATLISTSSPTAWPKLSLICLKWSLSRNSTAR
ncbi:hypothetical protein D3C79_947010 [compost metagenome]